MDVQGKTVAVTGKFNNIQRKEIELELARRGAKIAKSVTGKTEILIAGERAGSKLAKAKAMGILIVSEAELIEALKKEATVEVEAPKPKSVALPEGYEGKTFPFFEGKNVCSTGKLNTFTRAQLKALLVASGAKVTPGPNSKTDIMISGVKWGNKLRDAVHYKASIWSEGQLLLKLAGRSEADFPKPHEVPNGETLSKIEPVAEGETAFNTPSGYEGSLVLKWKKVPFEAHQRFLERHGFEFAGEHQFLGQFFYEGEALGPAPLFFSSYGSESWNRHYFWECGSDFDTDYLTYDGEQGFNCSVLDLRRKRLHVNWKDRNVQGANVWMHELSGKNHWYGDVVNDEANYWIMIDLDRGLYAFNAHTHPYIIKPSEPYGQ